MDQYEHEIVVGALLHDIGKFWQRAQNIRQSHPYLSAKFIDYLPEVEDLDFNLLRVIVKHHHDSPTFPPEIQVKNLPQGSLERRLTRIVCEADNVSSAWDREKGHQPETLVPLESIFSVIKLDHKPPYKSLDTHYFSPRILDLKRENLFALSQKGSDTEIQTQLNQLWEDFLEEVKELPTSCFESWYESLFFLLQKYTSFIPSAAYMTKPDIPLFDHAKTTAAIAIALWRYTQESEHAPEDPRGDIPRYLLIKGDLSGIQSYIYGVRDPQLARPGTAKRLRGRSLSIELLVDCFAEDLIKTLSLYRPNLILVGGGNFVILGPNLDNLKTDILPKFKQRVEKNFYKKYHFGLSLVLAWKECTTKDLRDFGLVLNELQSQLNVAKRQKNQSLLNQHFFEPFGLMEDIIDFCPVCGTFQKNESCPSCEVDRRLGQAAVKAKYLVRTFVNSQAKALDPDFISFNWHYFLAPSRKKLEALLKSVDPQYTMIYSLNHVIDLKKQSSNFFGIGFRFLGNLVPFKSEPKSRTLSFEMIAGLAKGSKRLGILKADVDDLGAIFALGLQETTDIDHRTISRIHSLSSLIDRFFAGYLNCLCQETVYYVDLCPSCVDKVGKVPDSEQFQLISSESEEEPEWELTTYKIPESELCSNCQGEEHRLYPFYINYSGGDDLVIIGPWDLVTFLARRLYEEFRAYTGNNPALTLSAGISLISPRFPISEGITQAELSLELAKTHFPSIKDPNLSRKNSIATLGECVIWDSTEITGDSRVGFLQLLTLGQQLENLIQNRKISKNFLYSLLKMWQTTFADVPDLKSLERVRLQRKRYVPLLFYQLARQFGKKKELMEEMENMIKPLIPWIRIPVSWVSLRTR
ncbi:MAG: type III-A CRISPR-associated protein Cas10/Csm1 [Candidatus Hodarchaeota archaeon]